MPDYSFAQSYFNYVSDPAVMRLMLDIIQSPQRQNLIYTEIGWLVSYTGIRYWASLKLRASRFLIRVLARIALLILFVTVSSYLLPVSFIGNPYVDYLSGLYQRVIRPHLVERKVPGFTENSFAAPLRA